MKKNDHDQNMVGFFLEGWYVFDNFSPFQIEWRGKIYPTSEHAYQAAHFLKTNLELAEKIRCCKSPRETSDLANKNKIFDDPNWKEKRVAYMEEIVRCKLEQHSYIKEILKETGNKYMVEMNDDNEFWGWGKNHDGQNELGKIWMKLRSELN